MIPREYGAIGRAACGLLLVAVTMLAGCAGSPPWTGSSKRPGTAQLQAIPARQDSRLASAPSRPGPITLP